MNSKNVDRKKVLAIRKNLNKSPFRKDKDNANFNMYRSELNITLPNKDFDFLENNTINYMNDITEEKQKPKNIPTTNKRAYLSKLSNNINKFGFTDSTYMLPINNRDISILTDSNIFNINNSNINKGKNINLKSKINNNNSQKLLKMN